MKSLRSPTDLIFQNQQPNNQTMKSHPKITKELTPIRLKCRNPKTFNLFGLLPPKTP